ncbi:MAG TPA: UdgX family uracil-DNA binding protein [Acidimicrobiales bacterium]|nr:UdgX family uracil-DNA binding protein [Acidimicrobiales bacterium]
MPRQVPAGAPTDAAPFVPDQRDLAALREAAAACRGCDLHRQATQTVFGDGDQASRVMLVGEQPGDREDIEGEPFVGPAGRLLDRALSEAGIDRREVYVTNAVKHFSWRPAGKRRIHKKPAARQVSACRPWLEAELEAVRPEVVVCLGATAAQSLLGASFRVTRQRGEVIDLDRAVRAVATVHPSSILRAPDESRHQEMAAFVADLRAAARLLDRPNLPNGQESDGPSPK